MSTSPNVSGSVQGQPQDKGTDSGAAETSLPGEEPKALKSAPKDDKK